MHESYSHEATIKQFLALSSQYILDERASPARDQVLDFHTFAPGRSDHHVTLADPTDLEPLLHSLKPSQ
jgi:hypothetical protein